MRPVLGICSGYNLEGQLLLCGSRCGAGVAHGARQVLEQGLEAVHGRTVLERAARDLGQRLGGTPGRSDRITRGFFRRRCRQTWKLSCREGCVVPPG